MWAPSAKGANMDLEKDGSNGVLEKAGILRQTHAGFFQIMPLGLRIQEKIERLADKHMQSIGASKMSLSSVSQKELWEKTGRITPETIILSRFFILCPTHEEEVTKLIAEQGLGLRDLPVRLYQISRKYRWEMRPRQGLLRSREFVMKDLYTFDATEAEALKTYHEAKAAYHRLFDELKVPYKVAEADSGNMGGSYSHEFHFPSPIGEDTLWSCDTCAYVANDELAEPRPPTQSDRSAKAFAQRTHFFKIGDSIRRVRYFMPTAYEKDEHHVLSRVKRHLSKHFQLHVRALDWSDLPDPSVNPTRDGTLTIPWTLSLGRLVDHFGHIDIVDPRVAHLEPPQAASANTTSTLVELSQYLGRLGDNGPASQEWVSLVQSSDPNVDEDALQARLPNSKATPESSGRFKTALRALHVELGRAQASPETLAVDLKPLAASDPCPRCDSGKLQSERAIELGHTFHLGTKYSKTLGATFFPEGGKVDKVPMSMGCHGIGVSRMIAAIAAVKSDSKGLNWPRAAAPWEVCVVYADAGLKADAERAYDLLARGEAIDAEGSGVGEPDMGGAWQRCDVVLDDRPKSSVVQKMTDADVVGYPVIAILGRSWMREKKVELQCRQLGVKTTVGMEELVGRVREMLNQL